MGEVVRPYLFKGVVPQWDLEEIYKGSLQFMVIQLLGLALIILFPQIALWLPAVIYGELVSSGAGGRQWNCRCRANPRV